ncbi:CYP3A4 family protein [Megaselia abdita]
MILYFLLSLLVGFIVYLTWRTYTYWEDKGIPYDKPHLPFGSLESLAKQERSFGMAIYDLYEKYQTRFVGIYLCFRPAILIRDAQLCKDILTKDFASFHDRGVYVDEKNDPFSANLFTCEGQNWKSLRNKLTPSFSSGKLKLMFPIILETSKKMKTYLLDNLQDKNHIFDIKDINNRYAIDIVASVIFGVEVDSFKDPDNMFRQATININSKSIIGNIRAASSFLCPGLAKLFTTLRIPDKMTNFIKKMVKDVVEYREKNNYVRKDLMQMLIQLRNSGTINADDNNWAVQNVPENLKSMSLDKISGQGFIFFVAGFDTTSSLASFCIYELAQNPDIMQEVVKEIDEVLKNYNGEITYEAISDMKFLEKCVMETLRKFPFPLLNRMCTVDYKVPESSFTIKKGTPIIISIMGLHRDPEYFPDPLKFDPNRDLNTPAYMPFGDGPRNCIAYRLGKVSAKVSIVTMLSQFKIECIEKKEIEIDNHSVPLVPKGGVNVRFSRKGS